VDPARDFSEGELDLALRQQDCPACLLSRETEGAVLTWMAKVNLRETATVRRLVAAGGLCGRHWSDVSRRVDRTMSRALRRALVEVARAAIQDIPANGAGIGPSCPVCAASERRAQTTIEIVVRRLASEGTRSEYARSFGLCQPHLDLALRLKPGELEASALLAIQRAQLGRLVWRLEAAGDDEAAGEQAARLVRRKLAGSPRM